MIIKVDSNETTEPAIPLVNHEEILPQQLQWYLSNARQINVQHRLAWLVYYLQLDRGVTRATSPQLLIVLLWQQRRR